MLWVEEAPCAGVTTMAYVVVLELRLQLGHAVLFKAHPAGVAAAGGSLVDAAVGGGGSAAAPVGVLGHLLVLCWCC
jgi:hypothetical protein